MFPFLINFEASATIQTTAAPVWIIGFIRIHQSLWYLVTRANNLPSRLWGKMCQPPPPPHHPARRDMTGHHSRMRRIFVRPNFVCPSAAAFGALNSNGEPRTCNRSIDELRWILMGKVCRVSDPEP